jgi:uncharacterized protein (DUF885 family)
MDVPTASVADAALDAMLAFHPHLAIRAGLHEYDGQVADWSDDAIARRVAALETAVPALEAAAVPVQARFEPRDAMPCIAPEDLTAWDAHLAVFDARAELSRWRVLRPHERSPLFYLPLVDISTYIKREYAPLGERLRALVMHLEAIPGVLASARSHLAGRLLARAIAEHSAATYEGLAQFHTRDLPEFLRGAGDARSVARFERANRRAAETLAAFAAWLRDRPAGAPEVATIDAEILEGYLATHEGIALSTDEMLALGEEDLERNQQRIHVIAGRLGLEPAAALAAMGRHHPPVRQLLAHTRETLASLRRFIESRELVTIPPHGPCIVQETLSFMRSGSAFMDAPGPFEPGGAPAFYYLTLPDPAWPQGMQEAWLAKQSIPGLVNTSIHEAWPGHFLQFLHLARAPSRASKLLVCTTFTEGWAHLAEQIMVEAGYRADDPRYELQQLAMALVRDCRLICAVRLRLGRMHLAGAAACFVRDAYFSEIRARHEALRCARDPSVLCYTPGKLMLARLRDDLRQAHPAWSQRQLHDALLAFGAPPIPLLRGLLLGQIGTCHITARMGE